MSNPPVQPKPTTTRSDCSNGQTWVQTPMGRLRVSSFKTHETWPTQNTSISATFQTFRTRSDEISPNLIQILQDSVRSRCYPMKSKPYLNGSGQISAQVTKSKPTNTTRHLTRLELADLTSLPSQFWITFLSTRSFQFESKMAQTRPMNSPRCIYLQE